MVIELITAHEADQQIRLKRPLGCDEQGRYPEAAHAATAEGIDPDVWLAASLRDNLYFWTIVGTALSVLGFGGALLAGWRPW
jgi:hypothetical protein